MIKSLLASILLFVPVLSRAATPAAPPRALTASENNTVNSLNKTIGETAVSQSKCQQCFDLENSLKADLDRKKAEITAEFRGKIPPEFSDLFIQKQLRLEKQHKTCSQVYEDLGKDYDTLMLSFRSVEPKSLDLRKQRAQMEEMKTKYLQMRPTAKQYNRPAPKSRKPKN